MRLQNQLLAQEREVANQQEALNSEIRELIIPVSADRDISDENQAAPRREQDLADYVKAKHEYEEALVRREELKHQYSKLLNPPTDERTNY